MALQAGEYEILSKLYKPTFLYSSLWTSKDPDFLFEFQSFEIEHYSFV